MKIDITDRDDILDSIGDIYLHLHFGRSVYHDFTRITNILFRYTPMFDKLLDALNKFEPFLETHTYNPEIVDYVLADLTKCVMFLSENILRDMNCHILYEPTIDGIMTISRTEDEADDDGFCEIEFF